MYFNTAADRGKWVSGDYTRMITFVIQSTPRGVYDWIQHNYPGQMPVWLKGFEMNDTSMEQMYQFVKKQADASNNALQYTATFMKQIPEPKPNNTWLKTTN